MFDSGEDSGDDSDGSQWAEADISADEYVDGTYCY